MLLAIVEHYILYCKKRTLNLCILNRVTEKEKKKKKKKKKRERERERERE